MVLPLLPEAQMAAGRLAVRQRMMDPQPQHIGPVNNFTQYLQRQWANAGISVHGEDQRTNNAVESFHYRLLRSLGRQHPNIWVFVTGLQAVEQSVAMDLLRLRRGEQIPIRQRPFRVLVNRRIGKYTLITIYLARQNICTFLYLSIVVVINLEQKTISV